MKVHENIKWLFASVLVFGMQFTHALPASSTVENGKADATKGVNLPALKSEILTAASSSVQLPSDICTASNLNCYNVINPQVIDKNQVWPLYFKGQQICNSTYYGTCATIGSTGSVTIGSFVYWPSSNQPATNVSSSDVHCGTITYSSTAAPILNSAGVPTSWTFNVVKSATGSCAL